MENKINRITDILRRDDGISGAMHYTSKSLLDLLKFLSDLEDSKYIDAQLDGENYTYILEEKYRWNIWPPKKWKDKYILNAQSWR